MRLCSRVSSLYQRGATIISSTKKPSASSLFPAENLCSLTGAGTSEHKTPTGTFESKGGRNKMIFSRTVPC